MRRQRQRRPPDHSENRRTTAPDRDRGEARLDVRSRLDVRPGNPHLHVGGVTPPADGRADPRRKARTGRTDVRTRDAELVLVAAEVVRRAAGLTTSAPKASDMPRVVAPCQSTVSRPAPPVVVTSPAGQVGVCWSSPTVRAWPAASTTRRAPTASPVLLEPSAGNVRVGFAGPDQVSRSTTSVVQNPCLAGAADCDDAQ